MNNIVELENKPAAIKQLAAQAALYSTAKTLFSLQLILSVPVVIGVAFLALALDKEWFCLQKRDISAYVGAFGMCLALLDTLLLNPLISYLRGKGATIQQSFDSAVLALAWNDISYGKRPDQEDIEFWAKRNEKLVAAGKFSNWYRPEVRDLPADAARLVCQRANCWWDMQLRRRYNICIGIVGVLLFASLIGISLALDVTTTTFFSLVIAPFLPFVATAPKLVLDNREAISRLEAMKAAVEDSWSQALQHPYDPAVFAPSSQSIQGGIFNNRSQSPLIFDWLADWLRPQNEELQRQSTEQYVADFKTAHPHLYP
ncbi:S-4TM family putative pore-forming effector [Massilia sp. 9I]|uniref:S-4TM family putative pore-forming effector n=1 Tax=Massilia sp. 9I TaxID=2653152 RepID=UPI0012F3BBA7|nr:S-4TM family putative pore-forming effector [Massilia sp. 9I]VXC04778.1 conserved membrane hypothetical protein [Massilia sp. 9I]